jgi:hypothetical protein
MYPQPPHPYFVNQPGYHYAPVPHAPFPQAHGMHMHANFPQAALRAPPNQRPHSNSFKYPTIEAWLTHLDKDPSRGEDDFKYIDYLQKFVDNGFTKLNKLALSVITVQDFYRAMKIPLALAGTFLEYAKEDMEAIRMGILTIPESIQAPSTQAAQSEREVQPEAAEELSFDDGYYNPLPEMPGP